MKRLRWMALLCLFYGFPAFAQEGESLSMQAPASWGGWKLLSENAGGGIDLKEWIPQSQEPGAWSEVILVYTFHSRPSGDVVSNVIRHMFAQAQTSCENMNVVPPKPHSEGAYTIAYGQIYCTRDRKVNKGRINFLKAIATERRIYLIMAARNVIPFEIVAPGAFNYAVGEEISNFEWIVKMSDFLSREVRVCTGPKERQTCSR